MTMKPPLETPLALDFRATIYLEQQETGARLTAGQRELFLTLVKDPAPLERYAVDGSTNSELSKILGLPETAIEQFETVLSKSRAELARRIRRAHLAAAEKGLPESLAWLTAEYLTVPTENGGAGD